MLIQYVLWWHPLSDNFQVAPMIFLMKFGVTDFRHNLDHKIKFCPIWLLWNPNTPKTWNIPSPVKSQRPHKAPSAWIYKTVFDSWGWYILSTLYVSSFLLKFTLCFLSHKIWWLWWWNYWFNEIWWPKIMIFVWIFEEEKLVSRHPESIQEDKDIWSWFECLVWCKNSHVSADILLWPLRLSEISFPSWPCVYKPSMP